MVFGLRVAVLLHRPVYMQNSVTGIARVLLELAAIYVGFFGADGALYGLVWLSFLAR